MQITDFILDKILKLLTRFSITGDCKVIWSQKQSGFWPTLYIAQKFNGVITEPFLIYPKSSVMTAD